MTFEELKIAGFFEHHRCGICDSPVGYFVHPKMAAACFQSGCGCGDGDQNYRIITHDELSEIGKAPPNDALSYLGITYTEDT